MIDTERIPLNKKQKLVGVYSLRDLEYVKLPTTGGVPNGLLDITHPSVYYNPGGWNGYTHWLVASPYPQSLVGSGEPYENPCIYYANGDSENKHPLAFTPIDSNPIYPRPDGGGYNSDPEIFFAEGKMWVVNRRRGGVPITNFTLQSSTDGHSWSEPVDIYSSNSDTGDLCPMYLYENGKHRIYIIQYYRNPIGYEDRFDKVRSSRVTVIESDSLEDPLFEDAGYCALEGLPNIWHGGMFSYKDSIYFIGCGMHQGHINDQYGLLIAKQREDTKDFVFYEKPIIEPFNAYRAHAFIDENNKLVVYLSAHVGEFRIPEWVGDDVGNFGRGNVVLKGEFDMDNLIKELDKNTLKSI